MKEICGVVVMGLMGASLFALWWYIGYEAGMVAMQREAITAGAGEWTADEDGRPVFTWKKAEE